MQSLHFVLDVSKYFEIKGRSRVRHTGDIYENYNLSSVSDADQANQYPKTRRLGFLGQHMRLHVLTDYISSLFYGIILLFISMFTLFSFIF